MGGTMSQSEINPDKLASKPSLKPVLFSILTLVSGIIIGSGVTLMTADRFHRKPPPPGPEYMSRHMIERLVRELHLSPKQRQQLDPVVKQHMQAMDEIRQLARPQIAEEIKQMNNEIMSLLNEKQKQVWNDKIQRIQSYFQRMRQRRGSEKHPPGDRSDPNFRHSNPRPSRRFRNNQSPEKREPSKLSLPPGDDKM